MGMISERLNTGIVKENPIFGQVLGMCPTLAVTTSAINGLGMGLATTAVLLGSNVAIAALKKFIPAKIRIPAFIVIIASFVTLIQFLLEGFVPSLYKSLGIFIPLIVVNCLILGRAEAYASKNSVTSSVFDAVGMGLGFAAALTIIGSIREVIGTGQLFGLQVLPTSYQPALIMILAPGAFFTLGIIMAYINYRKLKVSKGKKVKVAEHCAPDNQQATV
jgi:Na+-translocating ferredoxin:NAD+ oxidoreductase subunit E